jgi:invasion protein IalB
VTRTPARAAVVCAVACLACFAVTEVAQAQQQQQQQDQAQQQQPNQVLKETHGAWEIHCLEGTETCAMQQVGNTADGQRALLVTVQRLAGVTAEGRPVPAALTVNTPVGVLIPYGVRVRVDEGNVAPVPLLRCLPDNCAARAPLADEAIAEFKKGSVATFGFFLQDEVLVKVSLNGFTAAYDSMKPVQATQNTN